MADPASSPAVTLEHKPQHTESQPDPAPPSTSISQSPAPANPNPNPTLLSAPLPPPPLQQHHPTFSYAPPQVSAGAPFAPPTAPSFRPLPPQAPQFSPLPNPAGGAAPPSLAYQNPSIPPPGVSSAAAMAPGVATAAGGVAVPVSVPQMQPMMSYQVPPGQPAIPTLRPPYVMSNGYAAIPGAPQAAVPPAGMPRYPPPYGTMVRPIYPPRVPGAVNILPVSRPLVAGVPPVRPIIPPVVRPVVAPSVTPAEKPQITVYVGKIAPTVENDFMLSILQLCGPVKSWKRPQDLSNGTPKSFGFCEFETDEGVLRALRLLTKLNIDGQELMLNINETTKEHLKQYVVKKTEDSKKKETQLAGAEKDGEGAQPPDGDGKSDAEDSKKEDNDSQNKESLDFATFGIVTDDDREADREASEKITNMIEERLKTRPLPPPPPPAQTPGDGAAITSEQPAKTRDGDSDEAMGRNEGNEDKSEKDANSDIKQTSEHDKPETPDRRHDRKSRERDRDRELKREKDRELERYEREAERERVRKEREQRRRIEDAERQKKRLREKEDDLIDRQREEEEIAEAKKKAEEDQQRQQQRDALKLLSDHAINGGEKAMATEEAANEVKNDVTEHNSAVDYSHESHIGDANSLNAMNDESAMASVSENDARSSGNAPAKKLGFGLVGSGKRTTVPSVFHEEEDDDAHKDKKMRPLVPIDYSTEELQAVQPTPSGPTPPNLAAAAEFAKRISNANLKEEKLDGERDRSKRSSEKSNHRDRDKSDEDGTHNRDDHKEKTDRDRDRDHGLEKVKTSDNKRLLDAKQLIDMIPKTKEELFSYEINWAVYDKHQLHDRMRPWISKKIEEFLGEEENTLIDYIVASTVEHVKASEMLSRLQMILDEEAEMFVLKMWRMLIFEIKKVETGLALRSK
ncbi:hypothetical protein PIB30_007964 [Stylosanthes scabra]|uniref:RNA-binding protein 25 n=1 Tax=Stylosanthes scabra TaxID=79078 RepID=A0ABU6T4N9_9FABA|nr:hypothetical protein [Stylosanthes scabra]